MPPVPSAQYSLTPRIEIGHLPGMLGELASAVGESGGTIRAVDLVQLEGTHTIRDISVATADASDWPRLSDAVDAIPGRGCWTRQPERFSSTSAGRSSRGTRADQDPRRFVDGYNPGVARVCAVIHEDPDKVFQLTIKQTRSRSSPT